MKREPSQHPSPTSELNELAQEAKTLQQHLAGLLADLKANGGSLGNYSGNVDAAEARIKSTVGTASDIIVRRFAIGAQGELPALLAFVNGMVDNRMVDFDTLHVLEFGDVDGAASAQAEAVQQRIAQHILAIGHVQTMSAWDQLLTQLTYGASLLFIQGASKVFVLDTTKFTARSVDRVQSEPSLKGPQEAFADVLLTRVTQIRRRVRSPKLRFEDMTLGEYTATSVKIAYIEGLTNEQLVSTVKARIQALQRDDLQYLSQIGTSLSDRALNLFPLWRTTERVDWAVRDLLRGKIMVMLDNDPFVMTLPSTFLDFFQTTQDYVFSAWDASLTRIVRLVGLFLGLYLLPLYLAFFSVDPDLVPTKLVLTVAGSREGIPFPPFGTAVIMWVIIEILREAANRLPQQLATSLGTMGAVVVGTAIVKAGVVDAIVIVVVTLSALGLYTTPSLEITAAWRWLFWALLVGAYVLGIFGIVLVTVAIVGYLNSLEPLGAPYLSPMSPLTLRDWQDSWIRVPIRWLTKRPMYTQSQQSQQATAHPIPEAGALRPTKDSESE